jgi:hypothetical protein
MFVTCSSNVLSQDTYAVTFSALQGLQTLHVALPFSSARQYEFKADPEEEKFAAILAARLPDLHEIAFQSLHCYIGHSNERMIAWEVYHIIREGTNVVIQWEDPSH